MRKRGYSGRFALLVGCLMAANCQSEPLQADLTLRTSDELRTAQAMQSVVARKPAIDRSTPEATVESWWAFRDWEFLAQAARTCPFNVPILRDFERPRLELHNQLLTDEAAARGDSEIRCVDQRFPTNLAFIRRIEEVKLVDADTATVLAVIYNVTPIEGRSTLNPGDQALREAGEKVTYHLTKERDGWSIARAIVDRDYYDSITGFLTPAFKQDPYDAFAPTGEMLQPFFTQGLAY